MPENPARSETETDAQRRSGLLASALSLSGITLSSRFLGLVREQVRAGLLGTSLASDAFGIAFQIPNLLRRLVAEGAMSAGFIPVLSELREQEGEQASQLFAARFFNLSVLVLTIISTLGVLGAGLVVAGFELLGGGGVSAEARELTTSLTRWMFPYIAFVSWAAIMQGVLNTYRVFWISAATTIFLNLAIIGAAVGLSSVLDEPAYGFAAGVLLGGALQFLFQVPYVYRLGYRFRWDFTIDAGVRKALWLLVPTIFGAGVYQINVLVSQAIAWNLQDGAVSALQYSQRLLELTLGVFAVAISTVVLPALSSDAAAGRLDRVADTVLYSVRLCCFVCFPVTAGLFLVRHETATLLFERGAYTSLSSSMTAYALGFHLIGLTHIALGRVFVPVFYAFKDTVTPVKVAVLAMATNLLLCFALSAQWGQGGIAFANSASALVQTLALGLLMKKHVGDIGDRVTGSSLLKSLAATGAMAAVVYPLTQALDTVHIRRTQDLLGPYLGIVGAAVAVYVLVAAVLRHPELGEVLGLIRRKLGRG